MIIVPLSSSSSYPTLISLPELRTTQISLGRKKKCKYFHSSLILYGNAGFFFGLRNGGLTNETYDIIVNRMEFNAGPILNTI